MELALYFHGGSENHGCEAIVRGTINILQKKSVLYSFAISQDIKYNLDDIIDIISLPDLAPWNSKWSISHVLCYIKKKLTGSHIMNSYIRKKYDVLLRNNCTIALSVGGDNYCYQGIPDELEKVNSALIENNVKTILWGCSIEPNLLHNMKMVEDLARYALITSRESITYQALLDAGINNACLFPDPAFVLQKVDMPLPRGFEENNTVGINISPMIIRNERSQGIVIANYEALLQHIIQETRMQIALIPHVVWSHDDDREPLRKLYELFRETGRVVMIEDDNAMVMKGFIARCNIFVGSRTHATIAAYSSSVPTLVIGYSVKARGIAKDIFGTDENYVLPVQHLGHPDDLTRSFQWLYSHEQEIRDHLYEFMPGYVSRTWKAGKMVLKLLGE